MSPLSPTIGELLEALDMSRERVSNLLRSVYDRQDWQPAPDEWSFRYIAAHMAQVELDAVLARAKALAANTTPHYSYYLNTGWDFSEFDMLESLELWQERRAELTQFVEGLTAEQLFDYRGTHDYFDVITVQRVLEIALDHDLEHERDLQQTLAVNRELQGAMP